MPIIDEETLTIQLERLRAILVQLEAARAGRREVSTARTPMHACVLNCANA